MAGEVHEEDIVAAPITIEGFERSIESIDCRVLKHRDLVAAHVRIPQQSC